MKTVSNNQRTLNILNKAIANGFEFEESTTIEDVRIAAEEFLIENEIDVIEEECEVKSLGNNGQRVDWCDGQGFEYWSQGEIVDFSAHWYDSPDTKVFHETVIDSQANVVKLYYLVGETQGNAPEGFMYSDKQKRHVKIEY